MAADVRQSGTVRVYNPQAAEAGDALRPVGSAGGIGFAAWPDLPCCFDFAACVLRIGPACDGAAAARPPRPCRRRSLHFHRIEQRGGGGSCKLRYWTQGGVGSLSADEPIGRHWGERQERGL